MPKPFAITDLTDMVDMMLGDSEEAAKLFKKTLAIEANNIIPMDESLTYVALDISGRPHLEYHVKSPKSKVGEFDVELAQEFFKALVTNAKLTMHIELIRGENLHHIIESNFKAVARVLRTATEFDPRAKGVPSTKGVL